MLDLVGSGSQAMTSRYVPYSYQLTWMCRSTTLCFGKAYFSLLLRWAALPKEMFLPMARPGQVIVLMAPLAGLRAIIRTLCLFLP